MTSEKKLLAAKKWRDTHPNKIKELSKIKKIKYRKILTALKINGCAICGYNECNACLDFHHSNPEDKKFSIGIWKMARKDLIDELNKCILLCNRCHREIEYCGDD